MATIDVLAPSVPSNLAAVNNTTGTSVELSWSSSTDNVGVSEYEVYCDGSLAGTSRSTSFVAEGLQMVTTYIFSVKAKDDAGNISQSSSEISVTTPDTEAPVAPGSILQTEITNSSISIEWIPATDNISVTGYDIYNGTALAGSSDTNTFTLSGLSAGEVCVFSVKAKDAAGNESVSSPSITLKTNFNGGTVTKDTVINSSDSPYIIEENLTVASGVNLQIMPGTVIKLNPGVVVTVNGRIYAAGTNESPVVFTSVEDPDYGGTGLYNDADYWGCISISDTGEFDGEYVKIKYASTALNVNGKLDLNCSDILNTSGNSVFIASGYDVSITNTNIEDAGIGIVIGVSNPGTGDLTIEGNTIINCDRGVVIYDYNNSDGSLIIDNNTITLIRVNGISIYGFTAGTPSIEGNAITNNSWSPISISLSGIRIPLADKITNNTLTGNSYAGKPCNSICMYGSQSFDMTLTNNNSYLLDNITVNSGSTLTIQQGTVVKIPGNRIDVQGKLNAVGTASSQIVFTSMDDPDYGGTGIYDEGNGWEGISIASTGEFNGEYVKVKYGGRSTSADIYAMGICRLLNSEVCNSFAVGIKIGSSSIVTV